MSKQSLEALKKANGIRLAMAEAREAIRKREIPPGEIFDIEKHPVLGAMRVVEVLTAQQRWGFARARRFLGRAELFRPASTVEQVRLRDLTARERRALVTSLMKPTNPSS